MCIRRLAQHLRPAATPKCVASLHMSSRVQVILSEAQREAFRRQAAAKKMSLSTWLREAGLKQLAVEQAGPLRTAAEVREFFKSLPDEPGAEPDWDEHLRVMADSRRRGASTS